jgi:preprotein translocase subunit SecE
MIGKIKTYLTESYHELKKVNWPTRKETVRLTVIVIILSLFVALFLGVLDIVFAYILRLLVF